MDFERVLKTLLEAFERQGIRYAAIGGVALGLLGVPRATMDLDFLVHRDDLDQLDQVMRDLGYLTYARTEDASCYRHPDAVWGTIQVLYAFRKATDEFLGRAQHHSIFGGTQTVRVLKPEDVIGLKVLGMVNDQSQHLQEEAEIEGIAASFRDRLNWDQVQEFYDLFDLGDEAKKLKAKFGHAQ